jgi:hypothetical protein
METDACEMTREQDILLLRKNHLALNEDDYIIIFDFFFVNVDKFLDYLFAEISPSFVGFFLFLIFSFLR